MPRRGTTDLPTRQRVQPRIQSARELISAQNQATRSLVVVPTPEVADGRQSNVSRPVRGGRADFHPRTPPVNRQPDMEPRPKNPNIPEAVLTVRDYFNHFYKFRHRWTLHTGDERLALARAIVEDPGDQRVSSLHPALKKQLEEINESFNDLATQRMWRDGDNIFTTNYDTFQQALKYTSDRLIKWAHEESKVWKERNLREFFANFEVLHQDYTYDPKLTPLEEWNRATNLIVFPESLKEANRAILQSILDFRNWPDASLTGLQRLDILAKEKAADVGKFFANFEKEEGSKYVYRRDAYPPQELARLTRLNNESGKWDNEKIKTVRQGFNRIFGTTDPWSYYAALNPLSSNAQTRKARKVQEGQPPDKVIPDPMSSPKAIFCSRFAGTQYTFSDKPLMEEFDGIISMIRAETKFELRAREWRTRIPDAEFGPTRQGQPTPMHISYFKSEMHLELQYQFYRAVENYLEWLIDIQCRLSGLSREEYIILFFNLKPAAGTNKHKRYFKEMVAELYINIYDFIDHLEVLRSMSVPNLVNPRDSAIIIHPDDPSIKKNIATRFPSLMHLGVYCERSGRVYTLEVALQDGLLARLLRLVGQYFFYDGKVEFCELMRAKLQDSGSLEEVDLMVLKYVKDGYDRRTKTGKRNPIYIRGNEPDLRTEYPDIFCLVKD